MYYPKSQIISNLYTNGGEYQILATGVDYIGYYWKTSSNKYYTGRNPQSSNIQELLNIRTSQPIIEDPSDTLKSYLTFYRFDDGERPLVTSANGLPYDNSLDLTYIGLKNVSLDVKILLPYYSPTLPTQQDYQIGEMRRYFCKKINELIYLEINKDTHDKLVSKDPTIVFQYYTPFNISWQLTGNKEQVYKTNKNIVELAIKRQKLPQFDLYLRKDYIKYYQ